MNDNGFVYILINPSMENLVKIGKTERTPEDRAKELSSSTGVPNPFIVVYKGYFESCSHAEVFVHTYLEEQGYRVSANREFFEIPVSTAIDALIKAKEHFGEFHEEEDDNDIDIDEEGVFSDDEDDFLSDLEYTEQTKEPWEEVFDLAETYYLGLNDEIVDYEEALNYFIKAIKLGSAQAYRKVGIMYRDGEGVRIDNKKAFKYFKEGSKKNDFKCYANIAQLFSDQENTENAVKSWSKYFELSSFENYDHDDTILGWQYLVFIKNNNLNLLHKDKLDVMKEGILKQSNQMIDITRDRDDGAHLKYMEEVDSFIVSNL